MEFRVEFEKTSKDCEGQRAWCATVHEVTKRYSLLTEQQ